MVECPGVNTMETIYLVSSYIVAINLAAFIAMGIDKKKAVKNRWRIKESTLFGLVLLGGGIGGMLGMSFFHHKTRHWYFRYGFTAITAIETVAALYLLAK